MHSACPVSGKHLQELRAAVCANTSAGGAQLLRDALLAGGKQAQAALTITALLFCEPVEPGNTIRKAEIRVMNIR